MKLQLQPDRRMLRQFAWASLVLLPTVAWFLAWRHGLPTPWALAIGGLGVLVAFPIGLVVSTVLIAAIFYVVITPIGLVFRVIGRDVMGKRLDPSKATYWHERGAPRPATSYFKLY